MSNRCRSEHLTGKTTGVEQNGKRTDSAQYCNVLVPRVHSGITLIIDVLPGYPAKILDLDLMQEHGVCFWTQFASFDNVVSMSVPVQSAGYFTNCNILRMFRTRRVWFRSPFKPR
jgi:hypothetical protein